MILINGKLSSSANLSIVCQRNPVLTLHSRLIDTAFLVFFLPPLEGHQIALATTQHVITENGAR